MTEIPADKDLPPWVRGLRPSLEGKDWREATAIWLLGEAAKKLSPGDKTAETETGLQIEPSLYWYIARSEMAFGHNVFLCRASIVGWRESDGGVTPFDSGGLWHDRIHTDSRSVDKKDLFQRYNRSLPGWLDAFRAYIAVNYDNIGDYIQGRPPKTGSPPIMNTVPNSAQAWSWEGRVARKAFRPEQVEPVKLYWHPAESDSFLFWVETESPYEDSVQEWLTTWVIDHQVICSPSESPSIQAARDLSAVLKGF